MLLLLSHLFENDVQKVNCDLLNVSHEEIINSTNALMEGANYFSLEDLYEINYGLLESRYQNKVKFANDEMLEVMFLRQNSIREEDGKIELKKSEEITQKKDDRLQKEGKNKNERNYIPEKYFLDIEDCLINTRGIPRLTKLNNEHLEGDLKFVASHNFITLRPKKAILSALQIDAHFLEEMLEIIVNKKFKKTYLDREEIIYKIKTNTAFDNKSVEDLFPEKDYIKKITKSLKTNPKRSISAEIPSLKIDEIKNQKIILPLGLDQQKKTFSSINELKTIINLIEEKIELWKKEIYLKNQTL